MGASCSTASCSTARRPTPATSATSSSSPTAAAAGAAPAAASRRKRRAWRSRRSPVGRPPSRRTRSCSAPAVSSGGRPASLCNMLDLDLVVVGGGVALGFRGDVLQRRPGGAEHRSRGCRTVGRRASRRPVSGTRAGSSAPGAVGIRGWRASRCGAKAARTEGDEVAMTKSEAPTAATSRTGAARAAGRVRAFPVSAAAVAARASRSRRGGRWRIGLLVIAAIFILPDCSAAAAAAATIYAGSRPGRKAASGGRRRVPDRDRADPVRSRQRCAGLLGPRATRVVRPASTRRPTWSSSTGRRHRAAAGASSQTGPFYCPADHLVYFDIEFLERAAGAVRRHRRSRRAVHRGPRVRPPRPERDRHNEQVQPGQQ